MAYLIPFDPWKNPRCTCPPKFSLNPYTGCSHGCLYCYASSFIKDFFKPREKKNFLKILKKEVENLPKESLISLSNSSDPYQKLEEKFLFTRKALEIFKEKNFRVLIITKSDLVLRDLDLLSKMRVAVTMTITTLKHFKKLEPGAPPPQKRIEALKILKKAKIPVGLRLDPIIPFLNENEIEEIIEKTSPFILHLTTSTFKPKIDSWKRIKKAFPEVAKKLERFYFKEGEKNGGSFYLPLNLRKEIILKVRKVCQKYQIPFASCREGFPDLNTASSCDGSWLIQRARDKIRE